eukprot:CAMPEP_0202700170 /NCGR_PEP_ID=MMETSP1385-20130828/13381_1 /ASSEMBLY_ACC=CAM_ASM_000861 /TAXON_ID=933848 /ORGANISM="Elphidium margaritaceum" /LENGTH=371 /DNA_ID=CAMNT_0049357301 /DNA_START=32 /DNA_END=1150 /DNA_ORIENTATION=-
MSSQSAHVLEIAANIAHLAVNALFFVIIIGVSYKLIRSYQTSKEKPPRLLFMNGIVFNVVTFTCIFGLFFFSAVNLQCLLNGTNLDDQKEYTTYHSFWIMFYGKQGCLMLMIMFMRVQHVFQGTEMALSTFTYRFFVVCFTVALILFTMLPILHIITPTISIWTWCASTFCFYNLAFMMTLTFLFLSKLRHVFQSFIVLQKMAARAGVECDEAQKAENEQMVKTSTKTALLATSSIVLTASSCILLIIRFSFDIETQLVYTLSEWIISIDIYSNFLFVTLSYSYFDAPYYRLCKHCDHRCQRVWYQLLLDEDMENETEKEKNAPPITLKLDVALASASAYSNEDRCEPPNNRFQHNIAMVHTVSTAGTVAK